jgi:hypothetical protein
MINELDIKHTRLLNSDSNITKNDSYILCNAPIDTEMVLTLPTASGSKNVYRIKNLSSFDVSYIYTTNPDTIDYIDGCTYWVLFMYESITILDYEVGKWVILDATIWWPFWFGDGA